MITEDRMFFTPGGLALGKGLVYLLAFLTSVIFINAADKAYVFGVLTYSCGCICEYIELFCRKDKNKLIRKISGILALSLGILIAIALAMSSKYESYTKIKEILINYHVFINLYLVIFFAIPLGCGFKFILNYINKDSEQATNDKKTVSSYDIRP